MDIAFSSGDITAFRKNSCHPTANILAVQYGKMPCMELGEIVKRLMTAQGWRAADVAERVSALRKPQRKSVVARQSIDQMLAPGGVKNPAYLLELAKVFGKSVEDLQNWRPGMPELGPNAPSQAQSKRLTEEGSTADAGPELTAIRHRNAITSMRLALGAMVTVLASSRPDEAAEIAELFRSQVDPDYQDMGMGAQFLATIDAAVHAARARPAAPRKKAL